MRRSVVLHEEDGTWVAECPSIGVTSQGDTMQQALDMVKEACELYLDTGGTPDIDKDVPIVVTSVEIDDDAVYPKGFRALSIGFGILHKYVRGPASVFVLDSSLLISAPTPSEVSDEDQRRLRELYWEIGITGKYALDLRRLEEKEDNET